MSAALELREYREQPAKLELIQENPTLLIPHRLLELAKKPQSVVVIPREVYLGKFDEEYKPPIALLFAERDSLAQPTAIQETDGSLWGRVMNTQRQKAIEEGLLTQRDQVLLWTIARPWHPSGVFIESYIDAQSLRRQHLGREFFYNAEALFQSLGYKYWGGQANQDNLAFYLKLGAITTEQVDPNVLPVYPRSSLHTIKFMDEDLAAEALLNQESLAA